MGLSTSNKRIAQNTLYLYMRMVVMMIIGLYTSRVILNALGISDLGLMEVASSVVAMFTFLNSTLSGGTQRFLTFRLGEGNVVKLKQTFETAMTLHLILAFVILFFAETVGLWYIYNKLNIESGRFHAALWCYQLAIISTLVGIIQVPFNSALIAHEKMTMYAYMTIYSAVFKLLAAYIIQLFPFDRVIFYSTFCFFGSLFATFIYNWYCRKHFEECSFRFGYDKLIFKEMIGFSFWDTIGCLAAMAQGTGVNLVINSFCGTYVNGARGIATQANSWVMRFVDSFLTATKPQITKSYATNDYKRMGSLVCYSGQFGCYLILLLGIPLFIEIEYVINIWLGQCPAHTVAFMRIALFEAFFRTIGTPTITAMHATGHMKELNLSVGFVLLTILPISYLMFRLGSSPELVVLINVIPWIIVPFIRIFLLRKFTNNNFPVNQYIKSTIIKTSLLAVFMFIPPYLVHYYLAGADNLFRLFMVVITSFVSSTIIIYILGLPVNLRRFVKSKIVEAIGKRTVNI